MEQRQERENWDSENLNLNTTSSSSPNKYVELIEEENKNLKNFIHNILNLNSSSSPSSSPNAEESEKMKDELILMYELSLADLHNELKTLSTLLSNVTEDHEKEKEAMKKAHALHVQDVRRTEQMKFAKMVKDNQRLINDLIKSHREEIHQWRMEFERDVKMTVEEACIQEAKSQGQAGGFFQLTFLKNDVWEKFKGSSELVIVVFAGVISLYVVFKSYLPVAFMTWALPKLITFAQYFIQSNFEGDDSEAGRWISEFTESETGTQVMNLLVKRGSFEIKDFYDMAKKVYEEKSNDILSGVMKYITSNLLKFTGTKVKTV